VYRNVCCSVLQDAASENQAVGVRRRWWSWDNEKAWQYSLQCMLPYVAVCCSMLQYVAVCCSMLQYVAVCCSVCAPGVDSGASMQKKGPSLCCSVFCGVCCSASCSVVKCGAVCLHQASLVKLSFAKRHVKRDLYSWKEAYIHKWFTKNTCGLFRRVRKMPEVCVYVCVCVWERECVCLCLCRNVGVRHQVHRSRFERYLNNDYKYTYIYVYIRTSTIIYICLYIHMHIHRYMYMYVYVCVYKCICMRM